MNPLQNVKYMNLNTDFTVDNGDFTVDELDTAGWDYLTVLCITGNVPANMTALTITQSDSAGSGHAALVTYGTTTDIDGVATALPLASGGDGKVWRADIDLRGKKRYFDVTATAGNGAGTVTELCIVAILSRGETPLQTVAGGGADYHVRA